MGKKSEKEFISFMQESGLIWGPSPEIYGGLKGFYTYGPLGKLLKNKIENSIRKTFASEGIREIETPTILPNKVWKTSGHLDTFQDKTIKCLNCNSIFRVDKLIEEKFDVSADSFSNEKLLSFIDKSHINCPNCKGEFEKKIELSNLMMSTLVGGKNASLRPETATGTYLPFQKLHNYFRKKLPFGVFQIGKAYRNEISPRQHILRCREFTQAEGQIFIDPKLKNNWDKWDKIKNTKLPFWSEKEQKSKLKYSYITLEIALKKGLIKSQAYGWCINLAYNQFINFGINKEKIRLRQHHSNEKAFYADDAWDIEINLNGYGWTEFCGIHDRTNYDLSVHSKASGIKLESTRENGEKYIPHILEMAFGIDRATYGLIDMFYNKKNENDGKTSFDIPYHMSPIDVSILPLMKKIELKDKAEKIKEILEKEFIVEYDFTGSIGKRYLRSAIVGIPFAITIDYDTLKDETVTIRDRDSEIQKRIKISDLKKTISKLLKYEIKFNELK